MPKTSHSSSKAGSLAYLLLIIPWMADFVRSGGFPKDGKTWVIEGILTLLLAAGIFIHLRTRKKMAHLQAEINRLAQTDLLTTLGNPRALEEGLVREIARARRTDRPLSCIFLDLDDFKNINDRFGHNTGNSVLQVVGQCLRSVIRTNVDSAFRYGGDEFLIILPESDKAQAYIIAQRFQQALASLRPPAVPLRHLSASLGVAQLRPDQKAMDLLALLDKAMRRAKTGKKELVFDAEELEGNLQS